MVDLHILAIDLQNEFAVEGGALYRPRPCIPFITDILLPCVRARNLSLVEISSDYRVAAPDSGTSMCIPGAWGAQSIIPTDLKHSSVWVKAEPSPAWTRAGAGNAAASPGVPYPAPEAFSAWLATTIGPPTPQQEIIIIGLLLEICVLSTVQELKYRGYRTKVLLEGVDTYSGTLEHKRLLCETLFPFWSTAITWSDFERVMTVQQSQSMQEGS